MLYLTLPIRGSFESSLLGLAKSFSERTGIECELIIGSSGKLTAQITEGAPYDVFVSANLKYPETVFENGFADEPPRVYALGKLVLWSVKKDIKPSLESLKEPSVKHIALANPKTAPYGQAAVEVLKHFEIFDAVNDKLVYGESIAQTNQFIISKSAEVGFTAMSVVRSPQMKNEGFWKEIDPKYYAPIEQGIVVIQRKNRDISKAQQFRDFLFSTTAKQILKDFGYLTNE